MHTRNLNAINEKFIPRILDILLSHMAYLDCHASHNFHLYFFSLLDHPIQYTIESQLVTETVWPTKTTSLCTCLLKAIYSELSKFTFS